MDLREAKQILNENGYVLEEGKLGRALGIGALALGCLFGVSKATNFDNLRDADTTEIQNEYNFVKKDWDDVKIVAGGIRARTVMKDGTVYNLFKPTRQTYYCFFTIILFHNCIILSQILIAKIPLTVLPLLSAPTSSWK